MRHANIGVDHNRAQLLVSVQNVKEFLFRIGHPLSCLKNYIDSLLLVSFYLLKIVLVDLSVRSLP